MMDSWRDALIRALPYARRYARALTGSQPRGDLLVAESLRAMRASGERDGEEAGDAAMSPRLALYRWVTRRFQPETEAVGLPHDGIREGDAEPGRPADLPVEAGLGIVERQLLLLTTLEELDIADAAAILAMDPGEAGRLCNAARDRLRAAAAADVLIIEDEPIIAMDIEELVQSCGHRVVGVAASEEEAIRIAAETRPGLILADINLGAGGDGANAVSRITRLHAVPVIFVTAYPERLLTGEALEPAFVITKPFEPLTLAIATYQAINGNAASIDPARGAAATEAAGSAA